MGTLSSAVKSHPKADFKAFIFFIDGDAAKLKALNKELKVDNIALGVIGSDHEGMSLYNINPEAKTTILIYDKRLVKAKIVNYDVAKDQKTLLKEIEEVCR